MTCRKNVRNLSTDEKRWFVEALYEVRNRDSVLHPGSQSRYDDFVEIHRDAMSTLPDPAHGDSAFFPWHRELLGQCEKELQVTHPQVRIPYWDWTREQASGDSGFPFTYDFLGPNGDPGDDDRVKREPGATSPYPHPFDPDNWDITVKDGGEPDYLQRSFGTWFDAPELPENNSAVTGTSWSYRNAIDNIGYESHRGGSESIHNLVHRWCNGNMLTASSPNDPVFFLHHAAIDRMWSLWQGRNAPPVADRYVNTSGAIGHVETQPMVFGMGTPPWAGSITPADVIDGHAMHGGDGVWYDSDLPEISLESGSVLAFDNVPEGLTAYRAVRFRVRTCRPMRFRITGIPTAPYGLTALGSEFIVNTDYDPDPVDALVWIQFDASLGSTPPGAVQIEAYIIDSEGYYAAAEGGEFILGNWSITLTSSIVPRVGTSVAMALDRSYSMASMAGGGSTRSESMKSAVSVFHALLNPADEVGLIGFDHEALEVLPFGPASAGLGSSLASGGNLDPRGSTGIGLGIQAAAGMLATATHARQALLVLTDGNENVHPYVDELPAGTISATTYAVGFGLAGHVSDDVLNRITQNSGGDLVITGELATLAEQFQLTKYFLQILAGIQSQNVVLDPEGALTWGAQQVVDIPLTNAEVYVDVIVLCPFAPWLDFKLVTPGGDVIDSATAAGLANLEHINHPQMQCWRLRLPALPGVAGSSHGGTWKAVFGLRRREHVDVKFASHVDQSHLTNLLKRAVPWSCIVHATSNIQFDASVHQVSFEPGSRIELRAQLKEYMIPFASPANVWADVSGPRGFETTVKLTSTGVGQYAANITADQAGLYRFRIRAEGYAQDHGRFLREKTLTAGIFAGGDRPRVESDSDVLCKLLECFFKKGVITREGKTTLKRLGIDVGALRSCLKECHRKGEHVTIEKLTPLKHVLSGNLVNLISDMPETKQRPVTSTKTKDLPLREQIFSDPDNGGKNKGKDKGKKDK